MSGDSVVYVAENTDNSSSKRWFIILSIIFVIILFLCIITKCSFRNFNNTAETNVIYVLGKQGEPVGIINKEAVEVVAKRTSEFISNKCDSQGFLYNGSSGIKCIQNPFTLFYNSNNKTLQIGNEYVKLTGNSLLENLRDVAITTPEKGQLLVYNGEKWTNQDFSSNALLKCSDTQILQVKNGSWQCSDLNAQKYKAGVGLTLNGTTFDTNTPTSACPSGQVLTWDGNNFKCVTVQNSTYSAGNGLSLSGTTFSVNAPTCNGTDKLVWDGTQFVCSADKDTTYSAGTGLQLSGTTFSLNAGIDALTDVNTSTSTPTNGQVLKWDGSNWVPQDDTDTDTLASLSCSNNQIAKWNGNAWACAADETGTVLADGTTANSTLRWNGSSWVENTNFTVDVNGIVTNGTWQGNTIDISDYTNLAAGNGINLNGDTVEINAPTCNGTDKLQWNGSAFVCSADQDTTYSAGTGLQLSGTTFSLNAGIDLLTDVDTSTNSPTSGQVLKWDGSRWVPDDDEVGNLPSGSSGQTLRYDGNNWVANSFLYNDGSKIGIGTSSPNYALDVHGTTNFTHSYTATSNTIFSSFNVSNSFTDNSSGTNYRGASFFTTVTSNDTDTGATVRGVNMSLYATGSSGTKVGTLYGAMVSTSINDDLHANNWYNFASIVSGPSSTSVDHLYGIFADFRHEGSHPDAYGIYIDNFPKNYIEGKLGVNDLDPVYPLELPNYSEGGTARAYQWLTYSDARVKTEQEPLEYGLSDLLKLQPKRYMHHFATFKNGELKLGEANPDIGLVAQEVYKVVPEAVARPRDENKDLWSLDYEKLVPVIIKAIQDLAGEVDKMRDRYSGTVIEKARGIFVVPQDVLVYSIKYSQLRKDNFVLLTPLGTTPTAFSVEVLDGEFKIHLQKGHPAIEFKYLIVK